MIIIITILFYILRERSEEKVVIKNEVIDTTKDIGIEELIENKNKKRNERKSKTRNSKYNKQNNKNNNSKNN